MEALQEEMQDIRDLVLDMRASLSMRSHYNDTLTDDNTRETVPNKHLKHGQEKHNRRYRSNTHDSDLEVARDPPLNLKNDFQRKMQQQQLEMFNRLNKKIDELSCKLKENQSPFPESSIEREQKELLKHLEQKLEKLTDGVNYGRADRTPSKPPPVKVPVYVVSCPVCGGNETHRHGRYLFEGAERDVDTLGNYRSGFEESVEHRLPGLRRYDNSYYHR